ncbi:aspartokinase I/homoserine dehydrogenase I [Salmonella enterica subsp. enterica]|nr:aspartokinase I/homoserine dehydrogenase I [Salmonella enterica subsp. enterica]
MRVLKFGGTSVANAERFLRVADILESNARQGQVATVLSAPAKITNHLVAMIEKNYRRSGCFAEYQRCRTYFF